MKRACGVLLPIASLPSKYGIGCFSREAYDFVDFLARAGQSYWQLLPLGQTGYGDSPYQSFSTFAGNPYFIDPEALIEEQWIDRRTADAFDFGADAARIDYGKLYLSRFKLLRVAYENSPFASAPRAPWDGTVYDERRADFEDFCAKNDAWLMDYALYAALKWRFGGVPYIEWEERIRLRDLGALRRCEEELADEIRFVAFQQYLFFFQWAKLKAYANDRGIRLIGDIPIYVAFDSADTWSHPELFELDGRGFPTVVAGCPPDGFSELGQLWGNPIYRWSAHRETGYAWWISRMAHCFSLYDVVRIDHFRGFDAYYAIPGGERTAVHGTWQKGPGYALFSAMEKALGKREIIAEDLGFLTDSVERLVARTGYPGMKVLQFAFDPREESNYLPHTYTHNCVVYTGTHDNQTTRGWYESADRDVKRYAKRYLGIGGAQTAAFAFIRAAFMSVGDTVIIPMQDYLNLDDRARINTPSTIGGNWVWRMERGACSGALADKMRGLAETYHRTNEETT